MGWSSFFHHRPVSDRIHGIPITWDVSARLEPAKCWGELVSVCQWAAWGVLGPFPGFVLFHCFGSMNVLVCQKIRPEHIKNVVE